MQPLPLETRRIFSSHEVDEVRAHLCRVLRPHDIHISRRSNQFNFLHNQARVGNVTLNAISYDSEIFIEGPETEDAYLLKFTLEGHAEISQAGPAVQTRPDTLYVFNPTKPLKCRLSDDNRQLTMRISKASMEQHLKDELSCSLNEPIEFVPAAYHLDTQIPGIRGFVNTICDDLMNAQSCYEAPRIARQAEQLLIGLLLTYVPHNYSEAYRRANVCPAPYYVRRVEDYIRAHAGEAITLEDMVAVSGTSVRSLQTGFRKFRNMTPMEFLRNHRLDLAREELRKSYMSGRTVTEIALSLGFTHMSKFAKYYHERFGETPSQTLMNGGYRA
jgi:AraC-like DNA-binding protein